jgi:hypothetical protein
MAALPAHAVIQYSHAFENPARLPNADLAYAYGPPSAGSRRDSDANITASASAPTVVSTMANRLIGPYAASEPGRLKIPTPMMLPTISAVAWVGPRVPRGSTLSDSGPGSLDAASCCDVSLMARECTDAAPCT